MKHLTYCLFALFCSFGSLIYGEEAEAPHLQMEIDHYLETSTEPLFVSLGSTCHPGLVLRHLGKRKAAFPIDWMLSVDGEKIIQLLDTDFKYFTDSRYLSPFLNSGILLNTFYHMEFSHEGVWPISPKIRAQKLPAFQEKYKRRIERFRKLKSYKGKIYFLRYAWQLSTHQNYAFSDPQNLNISLEYAQRLHAALKRYFPNVDIYLIIKNCPEQGKPDVIQRFNKIFMLTSEEAGVKRLVNTLCRDETI